MLNSNELTRIRADLEKQTLPDTCYLLAVTRTYNSTGGWTEAWAVSGSAIACRLDHVRGSKILSGGAIQVYDLNIMTLPQATVVTSANRVRHNGTDYAIVSVSDGSWLGVKRLELEAV